MKILQINKFFFLNGGTERYMFNLAELLTQKGHEIAFFSMKDKRNFESRWNDYFVKNIDYNKKLSLSESCKIFLKTLYSFEAKTNLAKLLDNFKPDIAHIHNFNHQLTPSILFVLRQKKIPVVMTMHDYKLVCPSYLMLNKNNVCNLCKNRRFYHALKSKCHKNSYFKSLLMTFESYLHHYCLNSYKTIKKFICPSRFVMDKLKEMGLQGDFIYLNNFLDSLQYHVSSEHTKNILYFGRLSHEKGIFTLINAVKDLPVFLEIVGTGLLESEAKKMLIENNITNIKFSGYLTGDKLFNTIRESYLCIVPSEYYENNPFSIIEAFACGTPVIGARIGGIPELVIDQENGLLFEPGNINDLKNKLLTLLNSPETVEKMRKNVKHFAEKEYNPEKHYDSLIKIYNEVISSPRN